MSHLHYCDVAGHEWQCGGAALRPLAGDTELSLCICGTCQVPMEEGDHSQCAIELLACPQHGEEPRADSHGESEPGANLFADALQSLLDAAGSEGGSRTGTEY